ncbi:hypothetical protein BDFB_011983 [Asbolus verrucosus]|uniref:Uncharacterized protein n=1 Tax=Asbolus verrucosus TaxID=1661398 RepID=A0A482VRS5_ASBVE|nr:hypothetical protein BDFB_011983 [Asbolus verrucosus]
MRTGRDYLLGRPINGPLFQSSKVMGRIRQIRLIQIRTNGQFIFHLSFPDLRQRKMTAGNDGAEFAIYATSCNRNPEKPLPHSLPHAPTNTPLTHQVDSQGIPSDNS